LIAFAAMAATSASLDSTSLPHSNLKNVAIIVLRTTVKAKSPRGNSTIVTLR
jgi:hypothetical protein